MFFKRTDNLPTNLTSYDFIKFVTVLFMFADHVGAFFLTDETWWRVAGRLGFPVWFFLAGYSRGTEVSKTLWAGAILLIIGNLVFGQYLLPLNALVSYIVIRLVMGHINKRAFVSGEMLTYTLVIMLFLAFPTNYMFEYGTLAFILAMAGYAVRNRQEIGIGNKSRILFYAAAFLTMSYLQTLMFGFNQAQSIVCMVELCVVGLGLFFFRPMEFPKITASLPNAVNAVIRFGGRYTLEIYTFHLLAIKAYLLYANYGFYHWFDPTLFPSFPGH